MLSAELLLLPSCREMLFHALLSWLINISKNNGQNSFAPRHKSLWGWMSTEGAGRSSHQATFHHLSAVLVNRGGPNWVEIGKCDPHLQEGLEGKPGKLQACQFHLCARKGNGADHLERHQWHIQDNQGIRPNQHRFLKSRSCLTNLMSLHDKVTSLVDERKAVNVVHLDFRKAFDTVSHSILEKLSAHDLDRFTFHWMKNWPDGRVRGVINSVNSS